MVDDKLNGESDSPPPRRTVALLLILLLLAGIGASLLYFFSPGVRLRMTFSEAEMAELEKARDALLPLARDGDVPAALKRLFEVVSPERVALVSLSTDNRRLLTWKRFSRYEGTVYPVGEDLTLMDLTLTSRGNFQLEPLQSWVFPLSGEEAAKLVDGPLKPIAITVDESRDPLAIELSPVKSGRKAILYEWTGDLKRVTLVLCRKSSS